MMSLKKAAAENRALIFLVDRSIDAGSLLVVDTLSINDLS